MGPLMMDVQGCRLSEQERADLHSPSVGGVILFTRNYRDPEQLRNLVREIRQECADVLIAADTEGGRVQRFRPGFLKLPAAASFGRLLEQGDRERALQAAEDGGWLLAAELRAMDIDLAFAPVLDLDNQQSTVIGDRAFAASADNVGALARAHAAGMRAAGMAATGKHFPGHGFVTPDSHKELPVDERELAQIAIKDLPPYRQLIEDGLESVMVAHVLYPKVDSRPASISPYWIGQQLRGSLGFAGAVFSDDLSMGGLAAYGDVCQRFAAARAAGCDMIPVCNRREDLDRLLAAGEWGLDAEAQARLRALRGASRDWSGMGLSVLRQQPAYRERWQRVSAAFGDTWEVVA